MTKNLLLGISTIAFIPLALNAEDTFFKATLPSLVKNVAEAAENGSAENALEGELYDFTLSSANSAIDGFEDDVEASTNFTHLELSLGSDAFGLDKNSTDTKSELMSVYRIYEDDNQFWFNQTSLSNFNNRTTMNIGFGVRHINDDDTVITGLNAFYDQELDSAHERSGFGIELLTSMLDFRANNYNALTGTKNYKTINETALDGSDAKLTANLPYFYSSNVFFEKSEFKDGKGYKTETEEWGLQAEFFPNVIFGVSQQNQKGKKEQTVASLTYSIPLGGARQPEKQMQDGSWSTKLRPISEKLYKPVQRENRIMKKAIKLGVTVSGY
jgi:hypothetical protein